MNTGMVQGGPMVVETYVVQGAPVMMPTPVATFQAVPMRGNF